MERSIASQNKTIESQDYLLKMLKEGNNKMQTINVAVPSKTSPKPKKMLGNSKETTQNLSKAATSAETSDEMIPKTYADVVVGQNGSKDTSSRESFQDNRENNVISENKWNVVGGRRRKGRMIVGAGNESHIETKVKGVPKTIDLHVYRIYPNTTAEDLADMLKPHFEEVVTEALESRNPDIYSSFKVTIFRDNFEKAMDATLWPKNSCVRRFLYIRKKNDLVNV